MSEQVQLKNLLFCFQSRLSIHLFYTPILNLLP